MIRITTIPNYLRSAIIAIGIILAACTTQPNVPTPGATIEVIRNTAVPPTVTALPPNTASTSPTLSPTATATATAPLQPSPTPTKPPTATPTNRPTNTPRPAPTGTATLTAQIDLPDWVNDADTAVLLAHTYEGSNELISFINTATGARVDLDLAHRYGKIQWGEDEAGLYVELTENAGSRSDGLRDRIYIADGKTTRLPLASSEELATTIPDSEPQRYTAIVSEDDAKIVSITDIELGTITNLADPFNGRRTQSVIPAWSADQSYLVVWRGDWLEEERRNVGDTVIYNPQGAVITAYENNHNPQWSPTDDSLLFYTDINNDGKLCLTAVDNGTIDCDGLSLWREENEATTNRYTWSPDGRSIFFTYTRQTNNATSFCFFDVESHNIHCPADEMGENWTILRMETSPTGETAVVFYYLNLSEVNRGYKAFCFYNWATGEATCPVNETSLGFYFVHFYSWSPDGRYLSLILHDGCPGCDDRSFAELAIVDIAQNSLTYYGNVFYRDNETPWRPAPGYE